MCVCVCGVHACVRVCACVRVRVCVVCGGRGGGAGITSTFQKSVQILQA